MTVIPEFVSGVVLLYIFAVWLKWLPVTAMPPEGSPFVDRFYYLILPAIPLMFLELGYIARMARVGTVQVLAMPYIRTAVLKGLPRRRVDLRPRAAQRHGAHGHGDRQPGGLAARRPRGHRDAVRLPRHRQAHGRRRAVDDVVMLEASVLVVAVIYMFSNLIADIVVALLNPRIRMGG